MRAAIGLDRGHRGSDRLRRDLAAEHPGAVAHVGIGGAKAVRPDRFQVEELQQAIDGVGHGPNKVEGAERSPDQPDVLI